MRRATGSRRYSTRARSTRTSNRRRTYKNRRKFRLRRFLRPLMAAVTLSAVAAGCYYVLTLPALRVEEIKVTGTRLLSHGLVRTDAEPAIGRNILILSKNDIARRVMERPQVREVRVGRVLPGTVVVRVTEREPYVTITNRAGFWLVDKDGLPFHQVSGPAKRIPVVELPPGTYVKLGQPVKNSGMANASLCIENVRAFGQDVSKISVDHVGNLCLNIGSDFYVKLGQPVEIPEKLETLSKILKIGEKSLYIDVSCRDRPVVKPRSAADEEPPRNT